MLKRLFGWGKSTASPKVPPSLAADSSAPRWQNPRRHFLDYFNLHLHGLTLPQAIATLEKKYLTHAVESPVMLVYPQGEWITVYCAPPFVARVGFNKLASEIAAEHDIWLIGYRVYGGEGLDVHYFHGANHVAGLAMGQDEIEREPQAPEIFAALAGARAHVQTVVPRPAAQHPLDFHFDLLEALGISGADLTWDAALEQQARGELPEGQLLPPGSV